MPSCSGGESRKAKEKAPRRQFSISPLDSFVWVRDDQTHWISCHCEPLIQRTHICALCEFELQSAAHPPQPASRTRQRVRAASDCQAQQPATATGQLKRCTLYNHAAGAVRSSTRRRRRRPLCLSQPASLCGQRSEAATGADPDPDEHSGASRRCATRRGDSAMEQAHGALGTPLERGLCAFAPPAIVRLWLHLGLADPSSALSISGLAGWASAHFAAACLFADSGSCFTLSNSHSRLLTPATLIMSSPATAPADALYVGVDGGGTKVDQRACAERVHACNAEGIHVAPPSSSLI